MSGQIDLNDYISGGYFLVKLMARPEGVSELVPDIVLTLSTCFTDVAPDEWADSAYNYTDEEQAEEALKFGIPSSAVPMLVAQFTREIARHHITTAFPTLSTAQDFYRASNDKTSTALIGIGLHHSLLPSLYQQRGDDVNGGYGLIEGIEDKRPLAVGGEALGYEPLGYCGTKFHSWLCHYYPEQAWKRLAVRPNVSGFIDSLADAVRVTEDMKATGAEPAIWEPWLIVRYNE